MRTSRRAGAVIALVVVAVAAVAAVAFLARPARSSHAASVPLPARDHLVVLGDSVATGAGCDCRPFGRLLAGRVALLAHDGLTTAGLLDQVRYDARTVSALRHATTVAVTIGANDFDSGDAASGCGGAGTACYAADLAALPPRLGAVLDRIRALAGGRAQVLVTGYWNVFLDGAVAAPRGTTYAATSDALTRRVDALLAATAGAHGAAYVDLYRAFRGDGDTDDTALLAADGDHPSAAGHRLIARLLARAIAGRAVTR